MRQVIDFDGKMNHHAGKFAGLYIKEARKAVVEEMQKKGLIEKIDEKYISRLSLCYKCKEVLEPLPKEQWFMKVRGLADKAIEAVRKGDVKIYPKNFETIYFQWLEGLRDWNISRQIVWGIRIPAWKNTKTGEWVVTDGKTPEGKDLEQDTDTFDTWFSSGQWPVVTLKSTGDFAKFYPTSVMETAYDILKAWVTRMVMFGIYTTGNVPFKDVLFHGIVNDPYGKKMSKSKGNVINPLELADQYGADAVRFALIYGNATGNDQVLSYSKLDAAKKFANKLWNIARFIGMKRTQNSKLKTQNLTIEQLNKEAINKTDKEWVKKVEELTKEITRYLDNYQFNLGAERLYEFIWHEFADIYIEDVKNRIDENSFLVLSSLFLVQLKLLHPFMPFITEEIYQKLGNKESIMISRWSA
jgi:valyl-tRNA synthetase